MNRLVAVGFLAMAMALSTLAGGCTGLRGKSGSAARVHTPADAGPAGDGVAAARKLDERFDQANEPDGLSDPTREPSPLDDLIGGPDCVSGPFIDC